MNVERFALTDTVAPSPAHAGRRSALGRGLEALIPGAPKPSIRHIPLTDIVPDRSQPRKRFDEQRLAELAESIGIHGVLQPVVVSPQGPDGKYRLVIGERRWQAASMAGLDTIPALERDSAGAEALEVALVENLQRQDLDPLEEAAALQRLLQEHGLTQEDIARRVGRSRPAVANSLRLLGLPAAAKTALVEGSITEGHARTLLAIDDPTLMEMALARVMTEKLTVRETERLLSLLRAGVSPEPARSKPTSNMTAVEDQLRQALNTKVTVTQGRRGGRIVIEFYSDEDLDALVERLV